MADHGYAKATIQAIAKEAGLRPGLIHYHFKTKQDILVELIKQVHEIGEQRYEELAIDATTPEEKLKAFIDARLAKGEGELPETVAAWVVIGTEAIRQAEVKKLYQKAISTQKDTLEKLLIKAASVKLSKHEAGDLAGIIIAAMEGSFQLSVAAEAVMRPGYAAPSLLKLIEGRIGSTLANLEPHSK